MSAYKHVILWLGSVVAIAAWSGLSHGQDAVDEIASIQKQYDEARPHEKTPLLNSLLVRRDRLIDAEPDHPDAIFWRLAQLEDALSKGVRFNGLEYRVRYGLPDETEIVQQEKMLRVALEQSEAIDRMLPTQLGAAAPDSVLAQRLEAIRRNRLPYLRGMTLVIAADHGLMSDPSAARQEAMRLLGSDSMQLRPSERANASRYLAEAYAGEGNMDMAWQVIDRQLKLQTEQDFDWLGLVLAQYEMEALRSAANAAAKGQLRAVGSGVVSSRLLLIEQSAKHWMQASREALSDEQDAERLARHAELERSAFEVFLLLQPEQGGVMVPENQAMVDRLIEQRYGRLNVQDYNASHVPVSVRLAYLLPMLDDQQRLPEAHAALASLVDRKGLSPRVQQRLLALTMRAEALMDNHAKAVGHAIKWSTIAADREEAITAVSMAAAMATEALRRSPDDIELTVAKQEAVSHLLTNFSDHPELDRWRLEAGLMAEQDGDWETAESLYDQIDRDTPYCATALARRVVRLSQDLLNAQVEPATLSEARAKIGAFYREQSRLAKQFPREASVARLELNLTAAQVELMDSNPTKALEYLGRIQTISLEPSVAQRVFGLQLNAAIETNRTGAVEAIVSGMPDETAMAIISDRLVQSLLEPGLRLPLDPIPDGTDREMILYLTNQLADAESLSEYQKVLVMEGYRRVDEPAKSLEQSVQLLEQNPDLATAMFSRAESILRMPNADRAEAIGLYTRLSKMNPADEHDLFWTSQLRLLQLMVDDGRDMEAIEARLNRLQKQYPDLGGTPYIGEFAIVRSGLRDAILP